MVMRVSARAVLQALAGNVRHRPGWFPGDYSIPVHIFEAQAKLGRVMTSVRLERSEHGDDDWIVFEFDGPDAAASPFRVPH